MWLKRRAPGAHMVGRMRPGRQAYLLLVIALASLLLAPPARAEAKPTLVLVHGAWDRGASWGDVAARLRDRGYRVVIPENPLRSLAGDAAAIAEVIGRIRGSVVLVGHSYGGAVITNAATGNPRVKALVYIAGFVPDEGESLAQLGSRDPGSLIPASIYTVPFVGPDGPGLDIYINPLLFPTVFAADVPSETAAAMAAAQRPITFKAFTDASGPPAWRTIPSWYMVARQDLAIPPATERFMAERAGAHTVEIDSSHAALVSQPAAVTDLILAAAKRRHGKADGAERRRPL